MHTIFLLCARHGASPVIPIETVAKEYFNLTTEKFIRKVESGEIPLPLTRVEERSQKSAKFIGMKDLADYLDERMKIARRDREALLS